MLVTIQNWLTRRKRHQTASGGHRVSFDAVRDDANAYTTGRRPNNNRPIIVHVFLTVGGKHTPHECQILDLSQDGTKLFISADVAIGATIGLRIQFPEIKVDIATVATVCWKGCKGHGSWMIGCSFSKEIPKQTFQHIVESGYLERRGGERYEISIDASVRRNRKYNPRINVRLDDYSIGGFCMFSPERFAQGDHVFLELKSTYDSSVHVPAEVRWQKDCKVGFAVGCQFLSINGYEIFCSALEQVRLVNLAMQQQRNLGT